MTTYDNSITNKKFTPNVVVRFKNKYWSIRQPDSGTAIDYVGYLDQVAINPTRLEPFNASSVINSYSFKLLDRYYAVTSLFNGITSFFQGELVEIWIGRVGVNMSFPADYRKLPDTYVKQVSKDAHTYSFSSTEVKEKLKRPAFNLRNKLPIDILIDTTEIDADVDLSNFPASGLIKLEDEFISYAALDLTNNRFSGCIRGEKNSIPVAHTAGGTIFNVVEVVENPIDILLQVILSAGGGSAYDVLIDGAGIDQSLVNITQFETIRDEFFFDQTYTLLLYGIEDLFQYVQTQLLYPNEIRFITDNTSKLSLAILNRRIFDDSIPVINNDHLKKQPAYSVDDQDICNIINIEYDFSEGTGKYRKLVTLQDDDSIAAYGMREPITLQLKGVQEIDNGSIIATNIAQRFIGRFANPTPTISFNTTMDKSLINIGDKVELTSTQIPTTQNGTLNFVETLEVLERGINWKTGDVKFTLAFTSFTGIRECFLAPSDSILTFSSQKIVNIGSGRGLFYTAGWKMRLYDNLTGDYVADAVNTIDTIVGDQITFLNNWTTTLVNGRYRIKFCDYDDAVASQKRYCFISDDGNNFIDNTKSYQITL